MAAQIFEKGKSIVLENKFTEIYISKKDASVEKIIDKKTNKDIKGEETKFFYFSDKEREALLTTGVSLTGDIITLSAEFGSVDIEAKAFDNYFTFEVKTEIPEGAYRLTVAHAKYNYEYDRKEKGRTMAAGISMTIWMNPVFFPHGKDKETRGEVSRHLGSVEAKYGLVIAPLGEHYEILREMYRTVDREKGIVSKAGGVFSRDFRPNYSNYIIAYETTPEFLANNLEYYKSLDIEQVDYHQGGPGTFRQGDFVFRRYATNEEFKKNVSDVLESIGISTGLHTYSQYLHYDCDRVLPIRKWRDQLLVRRELTLAEDITADSEYIKTEEGVYEVSSDWIDKQRNSTAMLIDDEIIRFERRDDGYKIMKRGLGPTDVKDHKKGTVVKHLEGFYGLTPVFGSELFYEIARLTAKAYNEGGFKMIYLDAIDGMFRNAPQEDYWFYTASYTHEVLKHCNSDPIIEAADFVPSMYAARGRAGAMDYARRGYKLWNVKHTERNQSFTDMYITSTFGWYTFYPLNDLYPGNEHVKYHHTDAIDHMGSLAIMHDFSNAFCGMSQSDFKRVKALTRNVLLYQKYDRLRRSEYFSEEYREKMKNCPHELQLLEKRGGKYSFIEKDYQQRLLYDLEDEERNYFEVKNPFGAQVPFVRIEALLSTAKEMPFVLMRFNENFDLTEQKLHVKFPTPIDLSDNLSKVVRVKGNGVEGSKVAIKLRSAANTSYYSIHIIDTDFEGWREFVLVECENGERLDHHFEDETYVYNVHRSPFDHTGVAEIEILTEGDVTGVRMSDILAYQHTYEVLKNPTVKIRDTSIMFECELKSTDFIEFDGKTAKVLDRYGNEKEIFFKSEGFKAPRGRFEVTLEAKALNREVARATLTLGFTGKELK